MKKLAVAAVAAIFASSVAFAQAGGGPAPGSGDAAKATSSSQSENASYNRVVGSIGEGRTRGKAVPAKAADVVPGSQLRDIKGTPVGVVEGIEGDSAIVATASGRVAVPLIGFGKDKLGLLLSMTAAELEAAVKAANGA